MQYPSLFLIRNLIKKIKYIITITIISLSTFSTITVHDKVFPTYRIIIDPGHGGICKSPYKIHGDRFDKISRKYLDYYNEGASYKGLKEHIIVYNIAIRVKKILDLCSSNGDYEKFLKILKKFSDDYPSRVTIISKISRGNSGNRKEILKRDDINAEFRLFDFPDKNGLIQPGRISKINFFKPHLTVSLHCASWASRYFKGINPVIIPPYSFLYKGLLYLKGIEKNKRFFFDSAYRNWFVESEKRNVFSWFLNDVSVYFTGYTLNNNGKINLKQFRGYKYNMISWAYRDPPDWENSARNHTLNSHYASSFPGFVADGKFWEREQTKFEEYKRGAGEEGFGGDNLYASSEIIRYILFSLNIKKPYKKLQKLGKPYISVWSLPLLVNAINAYIELGYFNLWRDRYLLTKKMDLIAEGIAVGIYSLLTGLKPKNKKFKYIPKGKKIDLKKYLITDDVSYFDICTPK